jgi:hypothetical protein
MTQTGPEESAMRHEDPEERLRVIEVGDIIRMRIQKEQLEAEVRDRVSPILEPPTTPKGRATFRGFRKDAGGMWDLESVTGAPGSTTIEIVVRRAASDI